VIEGRLCAMHWGAEGISGESGMVESGEEGRSLAGGPRVIEDKV